MHFLPRFAILACLILGLTGCMKAAEKMVVPPPPPTTTTTARIELRGPYDSDIPREYQDRLSNLAASDRTIPPLFLAIAGHFKAQGEEEKALHFLDRAAEWFAGRQEEAGVALAFSKKAILLWDAGREAEALALLGAISEKWTAPPLNAFPGYLAGRLALLRGDFQRAGEHLRLALHDNPDFRTDIHLLELRRDTVLAAGMAEVLSVCLPRLAAAYRQGETREPDARDGSGTTHLLEALALNIELRRTPSGELIPETDFQRAEAEAHAFLGLEEGMAGNGREALRRLAYAAELSRAAGFREGELRSLLFLAELGLGGQNSAEGFQASETLRERAERSGTAAYRIWAGLLAARYEREQGRSGVALALLREAESILADRRSLPEVEMLAGICRLQRRAVYEVFVELLANEGRAGEALAAAEKGKTLGMADLLAGQEVRATPAAREMLVRETELAEAIRVLERRILYVPGEARANELREKRKAAEGQYRDLLGRLDKEDAKLSALLFVRGIDPEALRSLLDEDTTLFSYFVTDRALYAWAIHRQALHLEKIGLTREELRRFVLSFQETIRSKDKRKTEAFSRRAYDLLLKPIIPFVSGERIGFIPDDCLRYFPFAALNYRGRFLAEGFSIFSLPGAGLLEQVVTEKASPGLRILAFGNPDLEDETLDLHYAADEVAQIRKRIGQTTVLIGPQASEANATEMIADYDVLHFAVRGQFDPEAPLRSGLLLTPGEGQDGVLSALEVFQFRYQGRTVVLSGCDTRPEEDPEGKGLTALQRAFLHAGSSSIVSTLWLVDDRSAGHLLDQFYRQLARKESPADALRSAQRRLLREGHPLYVWGAFILTGRY
jgi:CHAT domain-containing protein